MDARVNNADDPSTSDRNLSNFDPVIPEFRMRVCAGRATSWALQRICSWAYKRDQQTYPVDHASTPSVTINCI